MYSKILYPTDFGPDAHKALEYIKGLKNTCESIEVIIVHIIEHHQIRQYQEISGMISQAEDGIIEVDDAVKLILKEVYPKLKKLEQELRDAGFKAEIVVEEGIASKQIVKVAEQVQAKIIVMGYSGRHTIKDLFMGSTVRHVLDMAKIPVLVVK